MRTDGSWGSVQPEMKRKAKRDLKTRDFVLCEVRSVVETSNVLDSSSPPSRLTVVISFWLIFHTIEVLDVK